MCVCMWMCAQVCIPRVSLSMWVDVVSKFSLYFLYANLMYKSYLYFALSVTMIHKFYVVFIFCWSYGSMVTCFLLLSYFISWQLCIFIYFAMYFVVFFFCFVFYCDACSVCHKCNLLDEKTKWSWVLISICNLKSQHISCWITSWQQYKAKEEKVWKALKADAESGHFNLGTLTPDARYIEYPTLSFDCPAGTMFVQRDNTAKVSCGKMVLGQAFDTYNCNIWHAKQQCHKIYVWNVWQSWNRQIS